MRRRGLALAIFMLVLVAVPAAAQTEGSDQLQAQVDAASKRIIDARVRADEASATFSDLETKADEVQTQLDALNAEVDARRANVDKLKAELQKFAIDRYTSGGTDESSIFAANDVGQAVARNALADLVGDHKADVLAEMRRNQSELEAKSAELEKQRTEQQQAVNDLASNNSKLSKEVTNLQAEYDKLNSILQGVDDTQRRQIVDDIRRRASDEAARKAEERRQKAEDDAKRKADADAARKARRPSGPVPSGPWTCPVPSGSSFVDSYGAPRSGGRAHKGVDMMAPTGTQAVAPVSGNVRYKRDSLGGLSFYLDGDDGNFYYGTHLSRYGDATGHVEAGTVIGYVGSTGNASTPHLHFEIMLGGYGNNVDPYPAVAQYC